MVWAGTPLSAKVRPSVREEAAEEGVSGDPGPQAPADLWSHRRTAELPQCCGLPAAGGDWASVITVTADRESRPKKSPSSQRSACWGRRLPLPQLLEGCGGRIAPGGDGGGPQSQRRQQQGQESAYMDLFHWYHLTDKPMR